MSNDENAVLGSATECATHEPDDGEVEQPIRAFRSLHLTIWMCEPCSLLYAPVKWGVPVTLTAVAVEKLLEE